jgi:hypothetical protein
MKAATAAMLARPTSAAHRGRMVLVALSTAVAGGLVLAAARIARLTGNGDAYPHRFVTRFRDPHGGLAPYVAQSGLRTGVVLGAILLTVPVLALAGQALRVGSLARERRMASLRLAGATRLDIRWVAGAEAGIAGLIGGLLAGPVYVLLWLLLGVLPPSGLRMMPEPDTRDALVWVVVLLLAGVGGGLAGAALQGRAVVEPLGVRRRATPPPPGLVNLGVLAFGFMLIAGGITHPHMVSRGSGMLLLLQLLLGLLLLAFAAGPRLVRRRGLLLRKRGGVEELLAGRRLEADPGPPGRVAAVLAVCGVALGIEVVLVTDLLTAGSGLAADLSFYLAGYGIVAVGVAVAGAVAMLTLLVGASDQLLDAHRPLASLAALGVEEQTLYRVLRRQQSATSAPAVVLGVLTAGAFGTWLSSLGNEAPNSVRYALLLTLIVAGVAGLAVTLVARLAARLLRSRLRAALDPENLRVA